MKFTTVATSVLLSGLAAADDIQSKPFRLVLDSSDGTINGKTLSACHSGAAIEGLCLTDSTTNDEFSQYYFNTTDGVTSPVEGYEPSGKLVWNLPVGNLTDSEAMQFYYDPSTNVAHPLFQPSFDATYVTFGPDDEMAIFAYVDDTVTPPKAGAFHATKQWYACTTYFTGYTYQTLNWVVGNSNATPQNPSCVKTEVKRVFV